MRNMNVAKKLITGFCIVAFACAVVGVVGIFGMGRIDGADTMLYEEQTKPLADIAKILEYSQRLRTQARNAIIYTGNTEKLKTIETDLKAQEKDLEAYMAAYDPTITKEDSESRKAFDEAKEIYYSIYKPAVDDVLESAKGGMDQEALSIKMENAGAATATMDENFTKCMSNKIAGGEAAMLSNSSLYIGMLTVIIVVIVGAIVLALLLAFYISGLISKPLNMMNGFLNRFGSAGNLELTAEDREVYEKRNKDEIGLCQEALSMVIYRLQDINKVLNNVADGDLTVSLEALSEKDSLGLAVNKMTASLNNMFGEIDASAGQVTTGAKQIADGAQSLALGTTEQASAMEELSSSIIEIAQKTKDNAEMAGQTADLANSIMSSAKTGNRHMNEMITSVKEINEASQNISKVIKVIDDIAFQTNILALNAAVEAARAGQHGKGFAVVAEEVRTLAAKSGEAAKDTGGLIANSMEKAELGVRIAGETAASLTEIVSGVNEAGVLVEEIAKSSDEQSAAITQINLGIDQVAQVIQRNSATAEESAAASEEMSTQAFVLEGLVKRFKLKDSIMDSFEGLPNAETSKHTEEVIYSLDEEEGEEYMVRIE